MNIGTAFPIAPGLLLTAAHVVSHAADGDDIEARWYWYGEHGEPFDGPDTGDRKRWSKPCVKVWTGDSLDAVLLSTIPPRTAGWVELSRASFDGREVTSEGFPKGGNFDGKIQAYRLKATAYTPQGDQVKFDLTTAERPDETGAWKGMSGALVIDEAPARPLALGMLTGAVKKMGAATTLTAVTGYSLWRSDGFQQEIEKANQSTLPIHAWRTSKADESITKELVSKLEFDVAEITGKLNEEGWSALAEQFPAIKSIEKETRTSCFFALLRDEQVKQARDGLTAALRHLKQRKRFDQAEWLAKLLLAHAVTRLCDDSISYVVWHRVNKGRFDLGAVGGSVFRAEILAAAIDNMDIETRPRRYVGDTPVGKNRIPLPPESGPDENGEKFVCDIAAHLEKYSADDIVAAIATKVSGQVFGPNTGETRGASRNGTLQRRLESMKDDGGFRSFYVIVPDASKLDEDSRKRLYELAVKVAELSKNIIVIALDVSLLANDDIEYGVLALQTPLAKADHAQ